MKLKQLSEKFKHPIALLFIIGITAFCCAWVGYDTVKESVGLGHREIVNDDYSVVTEAMNQNGVYQPITVKANTDFYGVNLNMHIFDRVCHGTVYAQLMDENGNVLATDNVDMTKLYDNTFRRFIFGGVNYKAESDKNYILHIYAQGETDLDRVAMWKSETTVDGFENITENGQEKQGTLALQYITRYVTAGMYKYFAFISIIFVLFLVGMYLLLFVAKAKISTVFVFAALVLGFVFSIYTPLKGAPDEYVHIASCYHKSNGLLGVENSYDEGALLMRECDVLSLTGPANYNAFELQQIYEGLLQTAGDKTNLVRVKCRITEVFPPLYWAQTCGITVARLIGLGGVQMIVLARLANLAVYVALMWAAIKVMPVYRTAMTVMALTPIPLQLAGSFNYDTLVIALCFLFTALVFRCAYGEKQLNWKDVVLLAVLGGLIAPSKTIYIVVVGLCLIIPFEKFKGRKQAFISYGVIICCAAAMWLCYNLSYMMDLRYEMSQEPDQLIHEQYGDDIYEYLETGAQSDSDIGAKLLETTFSAEETVEKTVTVEAETVTDQAYSDNASSAAGQAENSPEAEVLQQVTATDVTVSEQKAETDKNSYDIYADIMENGDNRNLWGVSYIIRNIPRTIKLVINTVQENLVLYIYQVFGGILGEVIVSPLEISWLYIMAVIVIVLLSVVQREGEPLQYKGLPKWWGLLIALAACGLSVLACITWTPINYTTIFGIQGRYFYPVLPLIVMFFTNENITVKKDMDRVLVFALAAVNVLILLDGFTIMAVNTNMYY